MNNLANWDIFAVPNHFSLVGVSGNEHGAGINECRIPVLCVLMAIFVFQPNFCIKKRETSLVLLAMSLLSYHFWVNILWPGSRWMWLPVELCSASMWTGSPGTSAWCLGPASCSVCWVSLSLEFNCKYSFENFGEMEKLRECPEHHLKSQCILSSKHNFDFRFNDQLKVSRGLSRWECCKERRSWWRKWC